MKLAQGILIITLAQLLLGGCTNNPQNIHPDYASAEPVDYYPEPETLAPTGGIYHSAGHSLVLFEDLRARQVGDIVTVLLVEATDAAKKSDTTLDKSSTTSIPNPVLAGKLRDFGDDNTLGFELESDTAFDGESASNQRTALRAVLQ